MTTKEDILKFSTAIDSLVKERKVSYMDAIILYCTENQIEYEVASKMISKPIKAHIKREAQSLNFLPKTKGGRLPIAGS